MSAIIENGCRTWMYQACVISEVFSGSPDMPANPSYAVRTGFDPHDVTVGYATKAEAEAAIRRGDFDGEIGGIE